MIYIMLILEIGYDVERGTKKLIPKFSFSTLHTLNTYRLCLTYGPGWCKISALWASRDIRGSLPCIYNLPGAALCTQINIELSLISGLRTMGI